jgi:hypothetical protein
MKMKKIFSLFNRQSSIVNHQSKGAVLVITMCVLVLIAGMVITCFKKVDTGYRAAYQSVDSLHISNLAESGVEYVIWAAKKYGIPGGIDTDPPYSIAVSVNTLTHTGQNWDAVNPTSSGCWAGKFLGFKDIDDLFTIASNTSDTITCVQDGSDDLETVLSNAGINAYDGYAIIFINTLSDGTFVAWYNAEIGEINSNGYLNF